MMNNNQYRDAVFEVFTKQFQSRTYVQETYQAMYVFVKVASKYL